MSDRIAVGIDLGTDYSCVAVAKVWIGLRDLLRHACYNFIFRMVVQRLWRMRTESARCRP